MALRFAGRDSYPSGKTERHFCRDWSQHHRRDPGPASLGIRFRNDYGGGLVTNQGLQVRSRFKILAFGVVWPAAGRLVDGCVSDAWG